MEHFARLFDYDCWANQQALDSLRRIQAPQRAVELLGHIVAAQLIWHSRITSTQQPVAIWPNLSLSECEAYLHDLRVRWQLLLEQCDLESLRRPVTYTTSSGEGWTTSVSDILLQVLTHGAYHRGQIATHLRMAGQAPSTTDFIVASRHGVLGPLRVADSSMME